MPKHFGFTTRRPRVNPAEIALASIVPLDVKYYEDFLANGLAFQINAHDAAVSAKPTNKNLIMECLGTKTHLPTVAADATYGGWKITTHAHDNDYGVIHPVIYGEAPAGVSNNISGPWEIPAAAAKYTTTTVANGPFATTTAVTTPAKRKMTFFFRLYVHQIATCEIFCGLYSGTGATLIPAADAASYVGAAFNTSRTILVSYNNEVGTDWRTILSNSATAATAATATGIPVAVGKHEIVVRVNDRNEASVTINGRRIYLGVVEDGRYYAPIVGIKANSTNSPAVTAMELKGVKQ